MGRQQGRGLAVELPALPVVVGHHRRGIEIGTGLPAQPVHEPIRHQLVQQLVGTVGLHHPVVAAQAFHRLGDLAGLVLDEGHAHLGHLGAHLPAALAQLGPVVGVALE